MAGKPYGREDVNTESESRKQSVARLEAGKRLKVKMEGYRLGREKPT